MNLWTDLGTLPRTRLRCTIMQPVGFLYVRATNVFFVRAILLIFLVNWFFLKVATITAVFSSDTIH